jgi:uracil-DNA glycosylase
LGQEAQQPTQQYHQVVLKETANIAISVELNDSTSKGESMDLPKLLGDKEALELRMSQVDDAHIASLSQFVRRLRERMELHAAIPYIDPWDGGVEAEVLFLLEAPGPKAINSGFVSMNNPDETAKNFFEISREVGIDRKRIAIWNTVPWYIGSGKKIRSANSADIVAGIETLAELLQLLPKLSAIVLVGGKAQKANGHIRSVAPHFKVFTSPHPSPLFVNRKPENRGTLLRCWQAVQSFLEG